MRTLRLDFDDGDLEISGTLTTISEVQQLIARLIIIKTAMESNNALDPQGRQPQDEEGKKPEG